MTDYDAKCYVVTKYLHYIQSKIMDGDYDPLLRCEDELVELLYGVTIKDNEIFKYNSNCEPINDEEILYWKKIFKYYCKAWISERKSHIGKITKNYYKNDDIVITTLIQRIKGSKTDD